MEMVGTEHKLPVLSASPHHVVLYLQHLTEVTRSKAATEEAVYALTWVHSVAVILSPIC